MQKVMFTRTVKVAQGDGKGPTFESGKAYWLREDSIAYWRSEDAITDAPAGMATENEQGAPSVRPQDIRIEQIGRGRHNVMVHGVLINDEPVKAGAAERLRQRVLAGDAELLAKLNPSATVAEEPVVETQGEAAPITGTNEIVQDGDPPPEVKEEQPQA